MKHFFKNTITIAMLSIFLLESPALAYASTVTEADPAVTKEAATEDSVLALTEANFPDKTFRSYLADSFDTDLDGSLSSSELSEVTRMNLSGMGIQDLTGIGYFTSLTDLDCSYNRLFTVDLSACTALTTLKADHNATYTGSISSNELPVYTETILFPGTACETTTTAFSSPAVFTPIKVTQKHFPDEAFLEYVHNYLDTDADNILSESELAAVTVLDLSSLGITDLTGLSYFSNLIYLNCDENELTELDLSANPYLVSLSCSDNYLSSLSLERTPYLTELTCEDNIADITTVSANCIDLSSVPGLDPSRVQLALADSMASTDYTLDGTYLYVDRLSDGELLPYQYDTGFYGGEQPVFSFCVTLAENAALEQPSNDSVSANSVSENTVSSNTMNRTRSAMQQASTAAPADSSDSQPDNVAAVVGTPNLLSVSNSGTGKIALSFSACENASGYEVEYSRNSTFAKNVVTVDTAATTLTLTNLPKKKTYHIRVRGYYTDTEGMRVYGPYSNTLSQKVNKGVKEIKYSSTKKAGKVKSCKLTDQNTFQFTATVKNRVASSDDLYYLCQVDPFTGKRVRTIKEFGKTTKVSVSLPAISEDGTNLIEGNYALFIKKGSKYKCISNASYISNPEAAATYTAPFPTAATKKGIQGADGQSDLGVSHSLINIPLTDVISSDGTGVAYDYNGKTYYFKRQPYVGTIKRCNEDGITISAVFLMPWDEGLKSLITSKGRKPGVASYYALNMSKKESRETLEAAFMYLAELYSREDCHLDNWILGNEVNVPNPWNYAGHTSYKSYVENYAQSFRTLYYAVVSHNKNARVYISLDHNWMGSGSAYSSKDFLVNFNTAIKAQQKKIRWNLAYHAYPVPLTSTAFWNNTLATKGSDSRYVTLKNITVLTNFVKKKFGSKTRIILSEQGFSSTAGEQTQAAAIAYGYYVAEFNKYIDAYIIRSDIDNEVESAQGLRMGLRNIDGSHKLAYDVFKYMDTPDYKEHTAEALKALKKSNWKKLVKGFKDSKMQSMPRRSS